MYYLILKLTPWELHIIIQIEAVIPGWFANATNKTSLVQIKKRMVEVQVTLFCKLSLHRSQGAHQAGAYPVLCSMKRLGVFYSSPPPGSDASPSQGYPQQYACRYPLIHLGGEWRRESKVSCPRTQNNVLGQSSSERTNHEATAPPTTVLYSLLICISLCFCVNFYL